MLDRVFDGAIVAKLEMQIFVMFDAAPVAAIKRVRASQVQGAGDVTPRATCQD